MLYYLFAYTIDDYFISVIQLYEPFNIVKYKIIIFKLI